MPYTGLNTYSPLSSYKGQKITTDILDSYERYIKPYIGEYVSGTSTLNVTVSSDQNFSLKKGTIIIVTFEKYSDVDNTDPFERKIKINGGTAYSVVTHGLWSEDRLPVNMTSRWELLFNGTAYELRNSLFGIRNQKGYAYETPVLIKDDWWFDEDVYARGVNVKTIPALGITYVFNKEGVYSGSGSRLDAYTAYGQPPTQIANFSAENFYGVISDVAWIKNTVYVVRCEWDEDAADEDATAITSLWKSTDGYNFSKVCNIMTGIAWSYGNLVYNGTYYVYGDLHNGSLYYSTNTTSWTKKAVPATGYSQICVANTRFYLLNPTSSVQYVYYATDPSTWTRVSVGTTAYWTNAAYGYDSSASQYYYYVFGGSGLTATANTYVKYSTSGTGSWTSNTVGSYGPVCAIYSEDNELDDWSMNTSSGYTTHFEILCGGGRIGSAYMSNGTFKSSVGDKFQQLVDTATKNGIQDGGFSDLFGYIGESQLVASIAGEGPTVSHVDMRHLYCYKTEYLINGELAVSGIDQGINVSKCYHGTYVGDGTYGSSDKSSLDFPFRPKKGIIQAIGTKFNICFCAHPRPFDQAYKAEDGIVQYTQTAYNTFSTVYMDWPVGDKVTWYSNSAAGQLNTSGQLYSYIFWG